MDVFLLPSRQYRKKKRPVILGLDEDTRAPRGLIADDKVTRLRVNLCYIHSITGFCVAIPVGLSNCQAPPPILIPPGQ